MNKETQEHIIRARILISELIHIEQELGILISKELDTHTDLSSTFFMELKKILYLRKQLSPATITLILSLPLPPKD